MFFWGAQVGRMLKFRERQSNVTESNQDIHVKQMPLGLTQGGNHKRFNKKVNNSIP